MKMTSPKGRPRYHLDKQRTIALPRQSPIAVRIARTTLASSVLYPQQQRHQQLQILLPTPIIVMPQLRFDNKDALTPKPPNDTEQDEIKIPLPKGLPRYLLKRTTAPHQLHLLTLTLLPRKGDGPLRPRESEEGKSTNSRRLPQAWNINKTKLRSCRMSFWREQCFPL
jgi:hypothetical protein